MLSLNIKGGIAERSVSVTGITEAFTLERKVFLTSLSGPCAYLSENDTEESYSDEVLV